MFPDLEHATSRLTGHTSGLRSRNSLRSFFPVFQRSRRTLKQIRFRLYMRFSGIPWIINVQLFSFNGTVLIEDFQFALLETCKRTGDILHLNIPNTCSLASISCKFITFVPCYKSICNISY